MVDINNNDNKQWKSSDAQYHCLPPLTDARPPFLNPGWPFWITTPVYRLDMTFHVLEYPLGQFGSPVSAILPPSFLFEPPQWQSRRQGKKVLDLGSVKLSKNWLIKSILILNPKHNSLTTTEKKITLSQLNPRQGSFWAKILYFCPAPNMRKHKSSSKY